MIVTSEINARSAAKALRAAGYLVVQPASLDGSPPKRIFVQASVADDEARDQLGWIYDDEPTTGTADADALHDLVEACLTGDIAMARALAVRVFENSRDTAAIEVALSSRRRAA